VSLIVARELTVSVLRMVAAGKGRVLPAEKIGKVKTATTFIAIILLLLSCEFAVLHIPAMVLYFIAVILTVYSGITYLINNKDVLV
jgi:CDP-diacylglycerol--glycerol-3-phosphate 3-phosphatidyltransferase